MSVSLPASLSLLTYNAMRLIVADSEHQDDDDEDGIETESQAK